MPDRLPNFAIHPGYTHKVDVVAWDDRKFKHEAQRVVYHTSYTLSQRHGLTSVFDIGCGSGWKLVNLKGFRRRIGSEIEPCFSFLKETYPEGEWIFSDLSKPSPVQDVDLVMASDVIEHLVNPDLLMDYIDGIAKWKYLVLSTPDRDSVHGRNHQGPPRNPCHVREWSPDEFYRYVIQRFPVISIAMAGSQIVVCDRSRAKCTLAM